MEKPTAVHVLWVDADRDGFIAEEAGGLDCDDTDPAISPAAEEWCDPVDSNCDGEPLEPGGCGKIQAGREMGRLLLEGMDIWDGPGMVSDISGDGVDDIMFHCWYCLNHEDWGYIRSVSTVTSEHVDEMPFSEAGLSGPSWHFVYGNISSGRSNHTDAGDVNGDGLNDVILLDTSIYGGGIAFIVFGPFEDRAVDLLEANEIWYPDRDYENLITWGYPSVFGGDYNNDGLSDAVIGQMESDGSNENLALFNVFYGGEYYNETGDQNYMKVTGWYSSISMNNINDIDADGINDLSITEIGWISGADLANQDTVHYSDIIEKYWCDLDEVDCETSEVIGISPVSDVDFDGFGNMVVSVHESEYNQEIQNYSGFTRFWGSIYSDEISGRIGGRIVAIDEKSNNEKLAIPSWNSDFEYINIILTKNIPYYLNYSISDISIQYQGYSISGVQQGDINNDGWDDFLAFDATETQYGDDVYLFMGWDIPWDDPVYW